MTSSNSGSGQPVVPPQDQGEKKEKIQQPQVAYRVRPRVIKPEKLDKLQRLIDYLKEVNDEKFTGYIKVNYTQGAIGRIERFEEILSK